MVARSDAGRTVRGTGSGECSIYRHNGIEYVLKENKVIEFYAGRLYKLILRDHAPNIIFIKEDKDNFYVGSQFESSYEEIWTYCLQKKVLPEEDKAGLAKIIVASFLLGEIDLKGLGSANSNIGIVNIKGAKSYFKIDHEQSFLFGGDYWRADYVVDGDLENKLWKYADSYRLTSIVTQEDLRNAAREIASIPLDAFEKECTSCEELCLEFPTRLEYTIKQKTEDMLLTEGGDEPKMKSAIINRIKLFKQYAAELF